MTEAKFSRTLLTWINRCWPALAELLLTAAVIIGISHLILPDSWLAFMFGSNLYQWLPWLGSLIPDPTPFIQAFFFIALCTWPAVHLIRKEVNSRADRIDHQISQVVDRHLYQLSLKLEDQGESIQELTTIVENMTTRIAKASEELRKRSENSGSSL